MAFHVGKKETDEIVRRFAASRRVGVTEAVHMAVEDALKQDEDRVAEKLKRMQAIVDEIDKWPRTGLKADKAFFDEISGD